MDENEPEMVNHPSHYQGPPIYAWRQGQWTPGTTKVLIHQCYSCPNNRENPPGGWIAIRVGTTKFELCHKCKVKPIQFGNIKIQLEDS